MFSYLSLHGGYAVFAAATGDGINTLNALHYESSDLGVKLVGASFLACCSILLCLRMENPVGAVGRSISSRPALILFPAFFLACTVYSALYLVEMTSGQFFTAMKESIFAICMWAGAVIFAIAIRQGLGYFDHCRKEWLIALGVLGVAMLSTGFYEVITGVVWAGTYYSTGFSYRTSGTLFNPNVLGFWCALVAALISLLFHLQWISRRATFGCMMAVICLLVLSSSRSGLMLSIVNLAVVSSILFLSRRSVQHNMFDQAWPFGAFLLAFVVTALLIETSPATHPALNTLEANLQRFLQLPGDIFWILMMKVVFPVMQKIEPFLASLFEWLPKNAFSERLLASLPMVLGDISKSIETAANTHESRKIMESISGRVSTQYTSDNSFVSIYAIGGPAALAFWLGQWGLLFWIGIKKSLRSPGVLSAHALGALALCFASGFFLRTPQLFPIWIFLAMVLGACLCWWSTDSPGSRPATPQKNPEPDTKTCAS
jgi:hypothetical protein